MLTSRKLKGDPEATANYHMGEENYYFSQGGGAGSVIGLQSIGPVNRDGADGLTP